MTKETLQNKLDELARRYFGDDQQEATKKDIWKPTLDLKHPPGLVGEVTDYINSQCRFPMEHLAPLSALVAVGNIGGLNHVIDNQKLSSNLFAFGIAGSSAGKDSVFQAFNELMIEAGMSGAVHGKIKSEQEIVRNLLRHQSALYNIDEVGHFLRQLESSHKSGGAAYLQGVLGMLLSAYSKASGRFLLSGDLRDDVKEKLNKEMAALNKKLDQGKSSPAIEARIKSIQESMNDIDKGLKNPFLSINSFSEPHIFNSCVSFESVTSGFLGRALLINEPNTNPRPKKNFECPEMPESLKFKIRGLCANGEYNMFDNRVESRGEKTVITTTQEAKRALDDASDWVFDEADKHTEHTGFEAVVRRGYEMMEKVSFILAMGGTERTLEHVNWAVEYVRRDIEYKTLLAYSNVKEKSDPVSAMAAKIMCSIGDQGITVGKIVNKYRSKKALVNDAIDLLAERGSVYIKDMEIKHRSGLTRVIFKA